MKRLTVWWKITQRITGCSFYGVCVLGAAQIQAQTEKGYWAHGGSISGSIGLGKVRTNDYEVYILGGTGYFPIDKLFTGVNLQTAFSGSGNAKGTILNAGPVLRYYLLRKDNPVNLFPEVSYVFFSNVTRNGHSQKSETTGSYPTFGAGLSYFVKQEIALETLATFIRKSHGEFVKERQLIFSIGLRFHLKR